MTQEATLRDYTDADAAAVLALNEAHVPEVGTLDAPRLAALAKEAHWMPVVELDGKIVGFAILLVEGADYASTNYGWFQGRHGRFLYVDRIAISEGARGLGIGQRIYGEALERAAASGRGALCAEVNTVPPNPGSMRFHERFGFLELERRRPYGDDAEVAMLERAVPRP